ncbi:MAG: PD-(D/E)XK nuclease family protein [Kiritimatiellia bacterium]
MVTKWLDRSRPLVRVVAEKLLQEVRRTPGGAPSLRHLIVVVPTAQSGRELRRALVEASGDGPARAIVPPRVIEPSRLVAPPEGSLPEAPRQVVLGRLALLLTDPATPEAWRAPTFAQGVAKGRLLVGLWRELESGGLRAEDVATQPECFNNALAPEDERRRWQEIAQIEQRLEADLAACSLTTSARLRQAAIANPTPPEGAKKIILPALLDANPFVIRWLERQPLPVETWLPFDPADANLFDPFGRAKGLLRLPPIPDTRIYPLRDPAALADQALALLADETAPGRSATLGLLDPALWEPLDAAARARGVPIHNPATRPLASTPLGRLGALLGSDGADPDYPLLAARLRQSDIRRYLASQTIPVDRALEQLDRLQNDYLPRTQSDLRHACLHRRAQNQPAEALEAALDALDQLLALPDRLQRLRRVLAARPLAATPADRLLASAATSLLELHQETTSEPLAALDPKAADTLFAAGLAHAHFRTEPDRPDALVTAGWLELLWSPEPTLIALGFNEGIVPDAIVGHPFLPDSLRQALHLITNDDRFRRDTALLAAILASRPSGAVHLLLATLNKQSDPLKPSRLLTASAGAHLPERVRRLYQDPPSPPPEPPATLPREWLLAPPEPDLDQPLRVTDIDTYRQCPLTFLLQLLIRGGRVDDRAVELDERAFGTHAHAILEAFAKHGPVDSQDARDIETFLLRELDKQFRVLPSRTPVLDLQCDLLRRRLRTFARWQAQQTADGWRIQASETPIRGQLEGFTLAGKIDRIDRHAASGQIRLVDYKTGKPDPDSLQLQIYALLAGHPDAQLLFLPLAAADHSDATLQPVAPSLPLPDARDQAAQLLQSIRAHRWWPPKGKYLEQTFPGLFLGGDPQKSFDPDWIAAHQAR